MKHLPVGGYLPAVRRVVEFDEQAQRHRRHLIHKATGWVLALILLAAGFWLMGLRGPLVAESLAGHSAVNSGRIGGSALHWPGFSLTFAGFAIVLRNLQLFIWRLRERYVQQWLGRSLAKLHS